jgi:hypothetical protein
MKNMCLTSMEMTMFVLHSPVEKIQFQPKECTKHIYKMELRKATGLP